jgi:protein-L-isoaspartate(D-aspartate) O-methyltransferase
MNIEQARFNMIEQQIRPWEVLDPKVLELLSTVPREDFVPEDQQALVFVDTHVRLNHAQVMMQPKQEARILQELAVNSKDYVLEIGTGSGYMTALLASLAQKVDSVDIFPDFLAAAQEKLTGHGLNNVHFFEGDAADGWDGDGPYDVIVLTGSVPILSDRFVRNLRPRGRLMAIVGQEPIMEARLIVKNDDGSIQQTSVFDTSLPPLLNAQTPPAFVF